MCAPSSHHEPVPQNDCLVENTSAASDAASAIGAATDEADWAALHAGGATKFKFSRVWSSDVVEAKALAMFAYMLRATRVLEVRARTRPTLYLCRRPRLITSKRCVAVKSTVCIFIITSM